MFLKHGAQMLNEIEMVAPTGNDHSGVFPPLPFQGVAVTARAA